MHEIRVSIVSPEAAENGVAELWAADKLIGYTLHEATDWMLRIEPRRDRTPVIVGADTSRKQSAEPGTYSSGSGPPSSPAQQRTSGTRL